MNLPCFFIWLTGLFYTLVFKTIQVYWPGIFVCYYFIVDWSWKKLLCNAGAYPTLFAFGATQLEKFTAVKRKYLRLLLLFFQLAVGLLFLPIALPILPPQQLADLYVKMHTEKTGALKWEDLKNHPLPQDFSDMLGWEEMTQKAAKAYSMLSDTEKTNACIFCNNYGMAGAVNYYASKYNLPQAYSDNASFLYWIPANMHMNKFCFGFR